ncbi:hypothetical protein EUX98_g1892 [Antrodiella citrinella]|uniref:N-acetyltransferase domain-containing protein n=1 Tax=Antrodiella citrinella TaxID=2447956 RepID=A0A4S4N1V3_9APHY|nr:hypothetical protein EUX98_g1892 [Antrodiella citrinella]
MSQTVTETRFKVHETFTLKQLLHPTETQIEQCAVMFADLMKDDDVVPAICGGDTNLLKPLVLAMIRAGVLDGETYAATNENDEVLGYVMTMPKGQVLFSTDEQRKGLAEYMALLSEEGKKYYAEVYLKSFPQFVAKCIDPETMIDVWWLHIVMTRERSQRQGIATGLIRMILDKVNSSTAHTRGCVTELLTKATAAGDTVALSTTSAINVPIYERMGFKLKGERGDTSPWGVWALSVLRYEPEN